MSTARAAAAVLILWSCAVTPPSTIAAPRLLATSQLLADPALAAEIDGLAAYPQVESERVGYGAVPSEAYARFDVFLRKLPRAQEVALIHHRSPVVRAYVARDILARYEGASAALAPLLSDESAISVVEGCGVETMALGDYALRHLCGRDDAPSHALLGELARSAHPRSEAARACRRRGAP